MGCPRPPVHSGGPWIRGQCFWVTPLKTELQINLFIIITLYVYVYVCTKRNYPEIHLLLSNRTYFVVND